MRFNIILHPLNGQCFLCHLFHRLTPLFYKTGRKSSRQFLLFS
jgi:hypothetical protein